MNRPPKRMRRPTVNYDQVEVVEQALRKLFKVV
jgi:hypothetical protein